MRLLRTLAALALAAAPLAALAHSDADWPCPDAEKARKSPLQADAATLEAGKKVYAAKCLSCHGAQGLGDGKASAYLKVKPSNLTAAMAQEQRDGELFWRISTGKRPMPGFADKLTETERWQVVAWVRTLAAKDAPAEKK